jgi:hypothetical protein
VEQLQALCEQLASEHGDAGHVPARPAKAGDEILLDGIGTDRKDIQ